MASAAHVFPSRIDSPSGGAARPVSSVFLPKEHGSWSLALEPLALGLLIAPSWAGGALAGAALAGFFARRPLKAAVDAAVSPRRSAARRALALLGGLALVGFAETLVLAAPAQLWPLVPATLLGAIFVWFDAQGESRAAAAEVAGSAAFAFVPAALATVAGLPAGSALAIAVLALARNVPTVLVVRTCLRRAKGAFAARTLPLQAAVLALVAVVVLVARSLAPAVAGLLAAVLLLRALWLLGPWAPAWPAKRLGMLEAALGLIYVVLITVSWATNA
jgi:hypothetical protein